MKKTVAILLLICVCLSLFACTAGKNKKSLTYKIEKNSIELSPSVLEEDYMTAFSVKLLKSSYQDDNILISPLSVMSALAIVQNGAENDTLSQFEELFGTDRDTVNNYLYTYRSTLSQSEDCKINIANSLWIKNDSNLSIENSFLQKTKDYYCADVYTRDFSPSTVREINGWVKKNTDKMIPSLIDSIPRNTVMYVINALSFEGEWLNPYIKSNVRSGDFNLENGQTVEVDFMYSMGEQQYIYDENTDGFIKHYKNRKYAFVALLPHEDIKMSDYIDSLTEVKLISLLNQKNYSPVH